jgi:hypothetical protein
MMIHIPLITREISMPLSKEKMKISILVNAALFSFYLAIIFVTLAAFSGASIRNLYIYFESVSIGRFVQAVWQPIILLFALPSIFWVAFEIRYDFIVKYMDPKSIRDRLVLSLVEFLAWSGFITTFILSIVWISTKMPDRHF